MRLIIFILFLLHAQLLIAGNVQITRITGYSNSLNVGSTTVTPSVYGGYIGDDTVGTCASPSSSQTCNNCVAGSGAACNTRRIHDILILHIEFTYNGDTAGTLQVGAKVIGIDASPLAFSNYTTNTSSPVSKGTSGSIDIEWGALCALVTASGDCSWAGADPGGDIALYISVEDGSPTYTVGGLINIAIVGDDSTGVGEPDLIDCAAGSGGICSFVAYPGDEKVTISELGLGADNCPSSTSNLRYIAARVFYSLTDFASASYGGLYADIPLEGNCDPTDDGIIDDLINGTPHFFRISVVDIAYNNKLLIDDPAVTYPATCAFDAVAPDPDPFEDLACDYTATPGMVNGLLPKDYNCFIATAAYGTSFEPKLKTLRTFRNQFLQTSNLGRKFIKFYYQKGPKAAKYLADKSGLRAVTRVALWPVWGLAWLSLHYGLSGALILILSIIGLVIFNTRETRRGVL